MKSFIKILSLLVALSLLCAGCGKEKAPEEPPVTLGTELTGPLSLGDQMVDLSVPVEGGSLTLSQLLQEKKLVVLNFWYIDCIWCQREFPAMEVSYQRHREDVEILALNPFDAPEDIEAFQKESSLSFPMASCARDLVLTFGISGYPTSVVIDRNGTICLIHPGAITDATVFDALFEAFTGDDYTTKTYQSITDLL